LDYYRLQICYNNESSTRSSKRQHFRWLPYEGNQMWRQKTL
jgi:hypothetical protein